jgi:exo-1,4-beta-D-glucosaminidase
VNANKTRSAVPGVHLRARILGLDASEKFSRDTTIDVAADTSMRVFSLPDPAGVTGAYFVDLRLTGRDGKPISTNFYWLSTRMDVLSDSSTWYVTPVKQYADFTSLRSMPQTSVTASARFASSGGTGTAQVTLRNPGKDIAFFLRLRVTGRDGEEALPVLWEDNYVSLLPGEARALTASYRVRDLGGGAPHVVVTGWNVRRVVAR